MDIEIGVPTEGNWKVLLNTDASEFGGSAAGTTATVQSGYAMSWTRAFNYVGITTIGYAFSWLGGVMNPICIHAHFYQPSRENPWTQRWEAQPSAAPYSSWNERITEECYAPNAAARLLDENGQTRGFRNTYVDISFDAGPTLLHWLEVNRPAVYASILQADAESCAKRNGAGSAVAQSYHHSILPLCDARDREVEIAWGLADFERRFGRRSRGIWMPETAMCIDTLEALAAQGVEFTIVAPHQVESIREIGADDWLPATSVVGITERPYRVQLPSGRTIALFVYDAVLARGIAFDGWLHDGDYLAKQLENGATLPDGIVHLATDGESYGHHHRRGENGTGACIGIARCFSQCSPEYL